MSKPVIIRIQSPQHGTKRVQSKPSERLSEFFSKVKDCFSLQDDDWTLWHDRKKTDQLKLAKTKTLNTAKLKHGDMLYLESADEPMDDTAPLSFSGLGEGVTPDGSRPSSRRSSMAVATAFAGPSGSTPSSRRQSSVTSLVSLTGQTIKLNENIKYIEDDVDKILEKEDGRVHRQRSEQMCRHGPKGKCVHCVPLEPYDEQYLSSCDPPIKFLSFHSYIRKLKGGADKGKFTNLENLSCKIKPGCKEHPPWPGGICTKCQPNAVTLNRQPYRHVDYVQFENPYIVERFLNYWRNTGNQRIGFLYGRYEPHKEVPLGIKAVVAAIYEPPQTSTRHSVELLDDPHIDDIDNVAQSLGLRQVGWMFTDLSALDLTTGTVKHFRGTIDTHFLSAEECIMAADFQNKHVNACRLSPDGHFGSKFVTVVVTGDSNNQIHFEGYQVSNQCMALVQDDILIPTKDAPELGYVKESSNVQYVPDVFYKEKDKYGNEVTQLARPLPVEYLLLDLAAAFPVEPVFTFQVSDSARPFPLANRADIGEPQDFNAFSAYMQQFEKEDFLRAISDFHVLIFMATCDMLPIKTEMSELLEAVVNKSKEQAKQWAESEHWATVEQIMQAHEPMEREGSYVGPGAQPLPPIQNSTAMVACKHCTFMNKASSASCEMCGLPPK